MSAALEVAGLRLVRDSGVLVDIPSLVLDAGTVTVVTGPTDSGKTMLASVLLGATGATAGTVSVEGRPLAGTPSARRRAGVAGIVGDGARISGCTVAEALALAGARRSAAAMERFAALAQRSGLRAELLSGGEQQMLQVACAWCAAPRVMVLDAPTTGLAEAAAVAVGVLAADAAADGAAVLWLDQVDTAAPRRARWLLAAGELSPAPGAASPAPPTT
jgi:branched-chain amino acid transport system ATP-binding protein